MKKVVSLMLVAILALFCAVPLGLASAAENPGFRDVQPGDYLSGVPFKGKPSDLVFPEYDFEEDTLYRVASFNVPDVEPNVTHSNSYLVVISMFDAASGFSVSILGYNVFLKMNSGGSDETGWEEWPSYGFFALMYYCSYSGVPLAATNYNWGYSDFETFDDDIMSEFPEGFYSISSFDFAHAWGGSIPVREVLDPFVNQLFDIPNPDYVSISLLDYVKSLFEGIVGCPLTTDVFQIFVILLLSAILLAFFVWRNKK